MIRRPPRSTRTDTLFPYTTLFRSYINRWRRDPRSGNWPPSAPVGANRPELACYRLRTDPDWPLSAYRRFVSERRSGHGPHLFRRLTDGARSKRRRATFREKCSTMLHGDAACTPARSEEHTSELQSLMRISYAVFCLKKKKTKK